MNTAHAIHIPANDITVFHRTTGGSNVQAYAANKYREEEDVGQVEGHSYTN